jgi:hypothetical protein
MPATKGRAGGVSIVRPLPMGEEEAVGTGGGCPWDFKPGGSPQAQGSGRGPVVRPQGCAGAAVGDGPLAAPWEGARRKQEHRPEMASRVGETAVERLRAGSQRLPSQWDPRHS